MSPHTNAQAQQWSEHDAQGSHIEPPSQQQQQVHHTEPLQQCKMTNLRAPLDLMMRRKKRGETYFDRMLCKDEKFASFYVTSAMDVREKCALKKYIAIRKECNVDRVLCVFLRTSKL